MKSYRALPQHEIELQQQPQAISPLLTDASKHASYDSVPTTEMVQTPPMDKLSLIAVCCCVLVSDTCRGILFPTLWLNVQHHGGNKSLQGIAIALFSLGRILSSPIIGYSSEIFGYKRMLVSSNIIVFLGAMIYASGNSLLGILCSQFILGIGAGSLSVSRSYVAEISSPHNRTVHLAYLTVLQYGGFTVMPLVGASLAYLGAIHESHFSLMEINMFTLPPLVLAAMAIICIIVLAWGFQDIVRHENLETPSENFESSPSPTPTPTPAAAVTVTSTQLSTHAEAMIYLCCVMNMITKGAIGVFETLGSEFATSHFHWSSAKIGYVFSISGAMGVVILCLFYYITKYIKDMDLVILGISTMFLSCAFLFQYNSHFMVVSELRFYISIVLMYGFGYPVGHTALLGMFSKVIKEGPQGLMFGWFASAGSLARIVCPLAAGLLTDATNDSFIFIILTVSLLCALVYLIRAKCVYHL